MKNRKLTLLALAALSLVAIVTILLTVKGPGLTDSDHVEKIRSGLVTQIRNYDQEPTAADGVENPMVPSSSRRTPTSSSFQAQFATSGTNYKVISTAHQMTIEQSSANRNEEKSVHVGDSGEIDWMQDSSVIDRIIGTAQSAARDWAYTWLQLAHPVSQEFVASSLAKLDMKTVGFAGELVRMRASIDRDKLESVLELPWVKGLGILPPEKKFNSSLVQHLNDTRPNPLPVFITFTDSNQLGEFRQILEELAVDTGHFDPTVRALAALIHQDQLDPLSKLDFIEAIEPIEIVELTHDSSIPQLGVDGLRFIGPTNGSYTGIAGLSTPVAVMDTGLNTNHVSIYELRKSICGENFVGFEDEDLWFDGHGHGTHVTGTVAGRGFYQPKFAGVAPNVEHIRFAKVLASNGFGDGLGIMRGMDYLGKYTTCAFNGDTPDPVKPLVVNMSLSSTSLTNDSRSLGARKIDSIVWSRKQVYVVANANSNIYGYTNYGASKNSLAVAMALDSGEIAFLSSRGPTVDGRLLPSITAPGVSIISTEGRGSWEGYVNSSGTSMSAPAVAGVVALLMDASHDYREKPALVRAQLMASAIKPDSWFESDSMFPSNNTSGPGSIQAEYGMGMVSARTTILSNESENGWTSSGAAVEVEHGTTAYTDIDVPEGAGRIDIVMAWDEPATDTIANAVLNDLNLWVDYEADCGDGPCGEYSSQSRIDNVEWIIIRNPKPGTYRVKVHGARVYTDTPRVGLAWTIIKGDSSPKLTLEANETVFETPIGQYHDHDVELTLTTGSFVSSGTRLHVDCRTLDGGACGKLGFKRRNEDVISRRYGGQVQREDGIDLVLRERPFLQIGEVALEETQEVIVHLSTEITEPVWIYFTASSWNGDGDSTAVLFRPAGNDEQSPAIASPENTTFEQAVPIVGNRGSFDFDPLLGWTESGEPTVLTSGLLPARSVWFKWEPDETGIVTFQVSPRFRDSELLNQHAPSIDVFQISEGCCGPSASPRVASSVWSAQLFALEGYEYRIRVSHDNASMPLTLNWMRGERPKNDNFANATVISGASGETAGSNLGATLEPGELYGQLASTVWFKWTAPEDGVWRFQIPDTLLVHVLAFVGDSVEDLRLVSNIRNPGQAIQFPAAQDATYHLMVASPSAYTGGWEFDELKWEPIESYSSGNNMFESPRTLNGTQQGVQQLSSGSGANVEPSEPMATGIQTRWWSWKAPATGTFTWYWNDKTLNVAAFSGSSIAELEPKMKSGGISGPNEFTMDAVQDEEYWFSLGRKHDEFLAYIPGIVSRTNLVWGSTPDNNTVDGAISLNGAEGSQRGTLQYATTESDGLSGLGKSSLWYTYEVEESGWIRFYLGGSGSQPTRISAFNQTEQGLELIMASRVSELFSSYPVEVYVYGEAGSTIYLRLGSPIAHSSRNFNLRWEPSAAPQWLRYMGRVAHGRRDGSGNIANLPNPRESVFNDNGTVLYIATQSGLSIYSRDPDSGELSYENEMQDIHPNSFLHWDSHRSRLYANHADTWWIYKPEDQDPLKLELVSVQYGVGSSQTNNTFGSPSLFMDTDGNFLYRSLASEQSIYSFDAKGNIVDWGGFAVPRRTVYPAPSGNDWYSTSNFEIFLDRRIAGSAFFERDETLELSGRDTRTIGTDRDSDYVFVADSFVASLLRQDAETEQLTTLANEYFFSLGVGRCAAVLARNGRLAADVICVSGAYVYEFDTETNYIDLSDNLVNAGNFFRVKDRFGRLVPRYSLTESKSVTPSPDGKHIYASTTNHGVLMFERFGNPIVEIDPEDAESKANRLDLLQASPNRIQFNDDVAFHGCLDSGSWTVDGVTYSVAQSWWQERGLDEEWVDIDDAVSYLRLCSYDPGEENEYRMVAQFAVDGVLIDYSSNFFANPPYSQLASLVVEPGSVALNTATTDECATVMEMTISDVVYSVANSKWQSRENEDSPWVDVAGTETAGELCPLEPPDSQEYRLVGVITIDGERGYHHSNYITQ